MQGDLGPSFLYLEPVIVDVVEYAEWRRGELAPRWHSQFPMLFDDIDLGLARKRWASGRHYFEWAAARHLHLSNGMSKGYHALVAKYEFPKHLRKRAIIDRLMPPNVVNVLRDRAMHGSCQAPDLFMFDSTGSDYFFCEVKGPKDRLRPAQRSKFAEIARLTGRPVHVFSFCKARGGGVAL